VGTEIEYRFLVGNDDWRAHIGGRQEIEQHYMFSVEHGNARIRISDRTRATMTIKGARDGATRPEYEWELDLLVARAMVDDLCVGSPIVKVRSHLIDPYAGWVVDEFSGDNDGLVIAELEVTAEGEIDRPEWLGAEVTHDRRFSNAELYSTPWRDFGPS
jgi:adenylate cyclase